jgi:hypothetical protein
MIGWPLAGDSTLFDEPASGCGLPSALRATAEYVDGHLVAVEVGVEGHADQRVQLDRLAFDQHGSNA